MSYYGGIEFDGEHVRATVIEGSPKKFRVVGYVEDRITGEGDEERRASLQELLGPAFFAKDRVGLDIASSIGADRTILREISVPYTRDEMIAKTIRYESESYILSHSIEDMIIEYIKCAETESGSRLLLCAVEKRRIGEEIERLRLVEIDPVAIELNATALATACARCDPEAMQGSTLLVQIERQKTTFVLLEEGRVTKVRSVWNIVRPPGVAEEILPRTAASAVAEATVSPRSGGADGAIEERFAAIERSLSGIEGGTKGAESSFLETGAADAPPMLAVVSDEDFERFRAGRVGAPAPESGAFALAPATDPFDRIVLELERPIAGPLLGGTIDRVIVTGSEAREMEATRRLSERFEVETRELPLDRFELALDTAAQAEAFACSGAVSCGLALRALGLGLLPFELRREEFRFERRFARLMPALALASIILCALSLVWMVDQHRRGKLIAQEIAELRSSQAEHYKEFFDVTPREDTLFLRAAQERLKSFSGGVAGARGGGNIKRYLGAMAMFLDIYTAIEKAKPRVYPKYDTFDLEPEMKKGKRSTVKLLLPTTEDAQAVTEALRAHSQFFDVVKGQKEEPKGGFEVTLELIYKLADSKAAESRPAEPGEAESSESAPEESAPTEAEADEPAPSEPAPSEPRPAEPPPAEPPTGGAPTKPAPAAEPGLRGDG
jgi:Tfp pilus assembly PilM family ATPase